MKGYKLQYSTSVSNTHFVYVITDSRLMAVGWLALELARINHSPYSVFLSDDDINTNANAKLEDIPTDNKITVVQMKFEPVFIYPMDNFVNKD